MCRTSRSRPRIAAHRRADACGCLGQGRELPFKSGTIGRLVPGSRAMPVDSSQLDQLPRLPVRQNSHQGLPLFDGDWGASDDGLQPRQGDAGEKRDLIQGPTAADAGEFELCNLPAVSSGGIWDQRVRPPALSRVATSQRPTRWGSPGRRIHSQWASFEMTPSFARPIAGRIPCECARARQLFPSRFGSARLTPAP